MVKASGKHDVPGYMLELKKASRQEKRQIAKRAVVREGIREESKYDRQKRIRKEQMIEASKRKKRRTEEVEGNAKKHSIDPLMSTFAIKEGKKGHNKD